MLARASSSISIFSQDPVEQMLHQEALVHVHRACTTPLAILKAPAAPGLEVSFEVVFCGSSCSFGVGVFPKGGLNGCAHVQFSLQWDLPLHELYQNMRAVWTRY